jgi:oxygen-independent coproporphyrinogen-3 oxidase
LGRLHDVREAKAALALALRTFERVSLDLIYARPGQSLESWRSELAEALSFGTEHLSLYQLTVELETPFATMHRRGLFQLPGEDLAATFFEITQDATARAGVPAYEISNHARPGCECRHNLLYWRYGGYAGVGPGAHGRLEVAGKRFATVCERLPERWRERVARNGHGFAEIGEIDQRSGAREHLLMNLRLSEGLDLAAYRARWGCAPSPERIAVLAADGLVKLESGRLAATPRGRLVLNRLIEELAV